MIIIESRGDHYYIECIILVHRCILGVHRLYDIDTLGLMSM